MNPRLNPSPPGNLGHRISVQGQSALAGTLCYDKLEKFRLGLQVGALNSPEDISELMATAAPEICLDPQFELGLLDISLEITQRRLYELLRRVGNLPLLKSPTACNDLETRPAAVVIPE